MADPITFQTQPPDATFSSLPESHEDTAEYITDDYIGQPAAENDTICIKTEPYDISTSDSSSASENKDELVLNSSTGTDPKHVEPIQHNLESHKSPGDVRRPVRGGTICCVPGCKHNSARDRHVSWHRFPRNTELRHIWVTRINRRVVGQYGLWHPTASSMICGAHFNATGKKHYDDKVPRFFQWKTYPKGYSHPQEKACDVCVHDAQTRELFMFDDLQLGQNIVFPCGQLPVDKPVKRNVGIAAQQLVPHADHTYGTPGECSREAMRAYTARIDGLVAENERLQKLVDVLLKKNASIQKQRDRAQYLCSGEQQKELQANEHRPAMKGLTEDVKHLPSHSILEARTLQNIHWFLQT